MLTDLYPPHLTCRLLRLLDVDTSAAPLAPSLRLLSLGDYFASLHTHGNVSWERALVSVADRYGMASALPLALFLPNRWRTERAAGGLLSRFPSQAATALVTTAISTLDFVAFGQTAHLVASQQRRHAASARASASVAAAAAAAAASVADAAKQPASSTADSVTSQHPAAEPSGPLHILVHGGSGAYTEQLAGTPGSPDGPVLLTPDAALALLGLTAEEAADSRLAPAPEPFPACDLLPDLFFGNGGLQLSHTRAAAALCDLLAAVANRLTANGLAGLSAAQAQLPPGQRAGQQPPFAVRLRPGGPPLTSLEDLLAALEDAGHTVQPRLATNLTSFGVGLSVRDGGEGGSWQQVPIAYPMKCAGLWAVSDRWVGV